jgi:hypothetical protein
MVRHRLIAGAILLAAASVAAAQSSDVRIAVLSAVLPGQWELRAAGEPVRSLCINEVNDLVQIEHQGPACSRFVIANEAKSATVSYSCKGGGSGQTMMRLTEYGSLQIRTQGIARNAPFDYSVEAKRVGSCGGVQVSRRR